MTASNCSTNVSPDAAWRIMHAEGYLSPDPIKHSIDSSSEGQFEPSSTSCCKGQVVAVSVLAGSVLGSVGFLFMGLHNAESNQSAMIAGYALSGCFATVFAATCCYQKCFCKSDSVDERLRLL